MFVFKKIDNWFTDEERLNIKNKVEYFKADWRHIKDTPLAKSDKLLAAQNPDLYKSAENQYFLGDATYVLEKLDQRNKTLSENLNVSFFDLYDKIVNTVKGITGMPTSYLKEYPRPGFHVFRGKQIPHPFEYHIDTTICRYDPNFKPQDCYSFLSLIESPINDPAGLEYKDTNDFDALKDYPEKIKLYDLNTFYYWKGDHYHRMKRFGMNDGESRITLQGHYVLKDNRAYIYW
jgi:hypothetical protein